MSTAASRSKIRASIQPFPRTPRYPTGWGGDLTFAEIAACLSPMMARKLARFGNYAQDIPDSIQTGLMRLWMRLVEHPNLLADVGIFGAMWRTLAISKHTTLEKQCRKYIPFTDIESELAMDVDEYGIPGYASPTMWPNSPERRAPWATKIDFRLDITEAVHAIAQEYADDMKRLVALYILTTSVDSKAALDAHNLAHSMVYERMTAIRYRLQRILKEYEPVQPRTWQERLQAGEIEPYLKVVEHYEDRPQALFAIYTLTTDAKVRKFARDEKERKMIVYYRKKIKKKLAIAYGSVLDGCSRQGQPFSLLRLVSV
ncbi:MAG: hypothetical protein K8L99_32295 [Anaerolineae bacterium]|nr:hypothetical protein [Anaerolineae bacterium]